MRTPRPTRLRYVSHRRAKHGNVVVLIGADDFANVIDPIRIVSIEQKIAKK